MSKLTIVPTPIGNLKDITLRGLEKLKECDAIIAEDTRVTKKLLNHFKIDKPLQPFHQHNEHKVLSSFLHQLKSGKHLCLVSDAGTPGISDPGFLLIRECLAAGIELDVLPGATAILPSLLLSGFPCDRFVFEGFLPHKKGRKTRLELLAREERTIVLYESPYRIEKLLEEISTYFPETTQISISRELTKIYEETVRGTTEVLLKHFRSKPPKGEFVVVIYNNFKDKSSSS